MSGVTRTTTCVTRSSAAESAAAPVQQIAPNLLLMTARGTRLDAIETDTISGLRDRALIGTVVDSFAPMGAVRGMKVEPRTAACGARGWLVAAAGRDYPAPAPVQSARGSETPQQGELGKEKQRRKMRASLCNGKRR